MLHSLKITGIEPFSPFSTFTCTGLSIPRGMFLGGCFYTTQSYRAPVYISYINCQSGEYLSTWGISDARGTELGVIYFKAGSDIGHIIGLNGQYSGCLKARKDNYNNTPVTSTDSAGDLGVFLRSLSKNYTLDPDTLVWDIANCSLLDSGLPVNGPTVASIVLPSDCVLKADSGGAYYMAEPDPAPGEASMLERLLINSGGSTLLMLSGSHVSILPYCMSTTKISGGVVSEFTKPGAAEDILGNVVDGAVVLAAHGSYPEA